MIDLETARVAERLLRTAMAELMEDVLAEGLARVPGRAGPEGGRLCRAGGGPRYPGPSGG